MRRLILAAVALALSAAPAFAIFGGNPVADSDALAHTVAAILYRDDSGAHLCTGTALGPRLILTAAHCTGDAGRMQVIFATTLVGVGPDRIRAVAKVARASKTAAAKGTYAYNNPDDVALVLLADDAPADTTFADISPTAPDIATLSIAGYGATSDVKGSKPTGFGQALRAATVAIKTTDDALIAVDQTKTPAPAPAIPAGPPSSARQSSASSSASPTSAAPPISAAARRITPMVRWHDWLVATARSLQ